MEGSRRTEHVVLLHSLKRLIISFVCCLPVSLFGLLMVLLLIYNSFSVFSLHLDPIPPIKPTPSLNQPHVLQNHPSLSSSSSAAPLTSSSKSDSSLLLAVKETTLGFAQKQKVSSIKTERRDELTPATRQKPQGKTRQRFKTRIILVQILMRVSVLHDLDLKPRIFWC